MPKGWPPVPRQQIWQPAQRIDHLPPGIGVKRVHGEIAPGGVILDAA